LQIELFWYEIEQIQQRHALFFPLSQLKYITLKENVVVFKEGYDLPGIISQEIQLAFTLIMDGPEITSPGSENLPNKENLS
ncbi:MAG TPA: hypothetical protein VK489_03820, partial [Ferruginibacter sp.]|nr:hypothetical protein [Ferruginibacter sp.]